ncbi:MAG: PAS domain S-box protein, partial [Anaerolineales bacterium]|nr:PAS domain S-box protein [Anaerolineales bacterium]
MLSLINDITELKRSEERIRQTERRSRALIENAPDSIVLLSAAGAMTYASPSTLRIFGYTLDEILASDPAELTHPEERAFVLQTLSELMANASLVPTIQYRFRRKDGSWRWVESTFSNLLAEPLLQAIVINFRDITERKHAEEQLRESEARYRQLFEHAPIGILLSNPRGQLLQVNPTALEILGSPSAEQTKAINLVTFPPLVQVGFSANFMRCVETEQPLTAEIFYTTRWGKSIHVNYFLVPILDANGKLALMQILMQDVTERKRAEEQLRASEEKFRAIAEQMIDTLFVTDLEGTLTYLSPSAVRTFGWQPAEMVGRRFADFLVEPEIPRVLAQFRSTLETLIPAQHLQVLVQRRNAAPFWGELSGSALVQNGQVVGTLGLIRDITDILKHQREIEAIATVSAALRAANARAEIVSVVVEHLVALLDAEVSALVVRDPVTGEAVVEAARGRLAANFVTRMPRGAGLVSLALN